ncbi:mitochondrial carrier [Meira miltonrushii]|uniref:Mitochondrial carrier n=1 Tax=Meira miltonrushii TaxID=1280837 RepID=A0A316VE53_9BASI|nr:mitochondrial carrier [Meira miltonrushii]PWN35836.1 mitochondrial carrier [Meira miltonrushii]
MHFTNLFGALDVAQYASTSSYTLNSPRHEIGSWPSSSQASPNSISPSGWSTVSVANKQTAIPTAPLCETDQMHGHQSDDILSKESERTRIRKEKQSWHYIIRSGLAGGVAGCVAKTAIAPLDRVKILFQAQNPEYQKYSGKWTGVFVAGREIVRSDGTAALFQGHSATLLRIFPYAAIKYMAYDSLHFLLMPTKEMETSGRLFFAGAVSGVTSVFITYPLELIRVRLAFETKRKKQSGSLMRIIRKIYTEGSTEAPFSGDARKRAGQRGLQAAGASTGSANLSTSAIQNAAIANGATAASPIPTSPIPTQTAVATHQLLQRFPILKFYRGFAVTVMGMIPYAGTSFLVFGRCKALLQSTFGPDAQRSGQGALAWWHPSKTTIDLSAGALAGAISQTAAYPFEVVRRRQQIGGIIRPGNILGVSETALWIYRTSGWRGFYVGLSIGFLKVVPMTSISFAVWMAMKRSMGI